MYKVIKLQGYMVQHREYSQYLFFGRTPQHTGILVPWTGIEPGPPAVEAWSLNHWTARQGPIANIL